MLGFRFGSRLTVPGLALAAALPMPDGSARAQEARFLVPDRHEAFVGGRFLLHFERGPGVAAPSAAIGGSDVSHHGGAASARVPWPGDSIRWFFVRVGGTQENRDSIAPARPLDDFVRIAIEKPGVTMLGADLTPRVVEHGREGFAEFVRARVGEAASAELLPRLLGAGDGDSPASRPVRVRWHESATLLARARSREEGVPRSATAQSKAGQQVEIRLLGDPTSLDLGGDLPVRTYVLGSKAPSSRVWVQVPSDPGSNPLHEWIQISTNPDGIGHFRLDRPGEWRLEFHHAEALEDDPDADVALYSATLVFEAPDAAARR